MAITAQDVKSLREATGAGMMDCKKALQENEGDWDKAVAWLREKGMASAAKRADRAAAEGAVSALLTDDGKMGVLVEVNCETDFVARGEEFQGLVKAACDQVMKSAPQDEGTGDDIAEQPYILDGSKTLGVAITELSGKTGEKITMRRFVRYQVEGTGLVTSYIHMGGSHGVLIELNFQNDATAGNEAFTALCKDLCFQICSANPMWVKRDEVPASAAQAEMEIYKKQAAETGKPENICEKIAEGKLNKWYAEVCLVEQEFVKDKDKKIKDLLQEVSKAAGDTVEVVRFTRYERGEGVEKKESNLAEEVAQAIAESEGK